MTYQKAPVKEYVPWWKNICCTTNLTKWKNHMFKNVFNDVLSDAPSFDIPPYYKTQALTDDLSREWEKEIDVWKSGGTPHVYKAVLRCYKYQIIAFAFLIFIEEVLRIGQAVLVGQLIGQFEMEQFNLRDAYLYSAAVCVVYILSMCLNIHSFHYGYQIKVALTSLIYKKIMKLPQSRLDRHVTEVVMATVSKGADIFPMVVLPAMYIVIGPLQLIAVCYLIWDWLSLTYSGISGIVVLLLLIPLQIGMGKFSSKLRQKTECYTSHRLKLLHTLLSSIYEHKMMVMEQFGQKFINTARLKEMASIRKLLSLLGCNSAITLTVGKVVMFVTFSIYLSIHGLASAKQVFTAFMLLETLRISMTILLPTGVLFLRQAFSLLSSVQMILMLDNHHLLDFIQTSNNINNDIAISYINYTGFIEKSSICRAVLMDINMIIRKDKLYSIVGPSESGKSLLMLSILGEVHSHNGVVKHNGKLAYISDRSWAFPGTIRDNIVFGAEFSRQRYNEVLDACDLLQSLDLLPLGDRTLIGDQGMVTSNSLLIQISLARAVYQNCDIYLLDSIFRSMDEKTSFQIFNRCICGLLNKKTRLLITDSLEHIKASTSIILMSQGMVLLVDSYNNIKVKNTPAFNFLTSHTHSQMLKEKHLTDDIVPGIQDSPDISHLSTLTPEELKERLSHKPSPIDPPSKVTMDTLTGPDGDESDESLHTVRESYWRYFCFSSGSCLALIAFLFLMSIEQVLLIICEWWLAEWPGVRARGAARVIPEVTLSTQNITDQPADQSLMMRNIYIYLLFTILTIILGILQAVFFFNLAHFISKKLHEQSLTGFISSPFSFFQTNTIGVLMSRFTRDTCIVDNMAPTYLDFMQSLTLLFGTLLMISVINTWLFLVAPLIFVVFLIVRYHFMKMTSGLQRTEIAAKSAVGSHISSTIGGLKIIHTLGEEKRFIDNFYILQDRNTDVLYLHIATKRWFGLRVDALGLLAVISVVFGAVLLVQFRDYKISAPLFGLSLVYAVNLLNVLQPAILKSSDVQFKMESIERLLQCASLPSESDLLPAVGLKPLPSWPMYGIITLEGLTVHPLYKAPGVLRNVWCCFRAQEKVGILFKSKSEQQALMNVFCRFTSFNGLLRIDGVDASTIDVTKLRTSISFIPQEPPLFMGTLRQVLDPDMAYTDSEIWNILTKVQLSSEIDKLPHNIYSNCNTVNEVLSAGWRQLICVTRALLKKSKIVLIEESQSHTNSRCQAILNLVTRTEFTGCTVLYMAQLPHTVIDFDRVMIIADGKIKEFDPPHLLLNNKQSLFYKMSMELGERELKRLKQVAQYKYENKPYVAPPMNAPQAAEPNQTMANSRDPSNIVGLPSFHSSRLVSVLNHLPTNKFSTNRL